MASGGPGGISLGERSGSHPTTGNAHLLTLTEDFSAQRCKGLLPGAFRTLDVPKHETQRR